MTTKIKVGIFFGGNSKEREVSFAGGRTVYDNLNKSLFEAIPVFVDSFNNFVLLNWECVYKGSIRDFYPAVNDYPAKKGDFQIYAESIGIIGKHEQQALTNSIGTHITIDELSTRIDFAFLALHGPFGEDGKLQGVLDFYNIPFSGSGILPSAIGINKAVQKKLMRDAGFNVPKVITIKREEYIGGKCAHKFEQAAQTIGYPMVVKPANQGSSIGITILNDTSEMAYMLAVEKAFFTRWISADEWRTMTKAAQHEYTKSLADIREGVGMPVRVNNGTAASIIYHPFDLEYYLIKNFANGTQGILVESLDAESEVLIESFIDGKEFSCVVIQDENDAPQALPPTEIRKNGDLFDYRKKYLPGLSRKITPIDIPTEQINAIRAECEKLFVELHFNVYARIDGFITNDGKIFLNDPNTTSGMMPSSFFFHQAAEIGLNPSQFLTYIIRTSLRQRCLEAKLNLTYEAVLHHLDAAILHLKNNTNSKTKIAVLLGGYSSERHISVESGRNIYEKLASSSQYEPIPIFVTGSNEDVQLYQIPINVLLKDNADDIKEKVDNYKIHEVIHQIIHTCNSITHKYSNADSLAAPKRITFAELGTLVQGVFIALHGRPGEDGKVQQELQKVGLYYNGSGPESSLITINKYDTNALLMQHGMLAAKHNLIQKTDWNNDTEKTIAFIESNYPYPFITKPVDDGCSSAVKKIKNRNELQAFAKLIFRNSETLDAKAIEVLHIKEKEEFPSKPLFLIEELISKKDADHFLEITGGMLTSYDVQGNINYELFEASETLTTGDVLSLEEKFLAGQGQNLTPARYHSNPEIRQKISEQVKHELEKAARVLNIQGYCRIDAFVRVYGDADKVEVIFIEVNSLPGMTPATCIFHQTAINGYTPYAFIHNILEFGKQRSKLVTA